MSDASPFAFPHATRTLDGREVRFAKWTPRLRQALLDKLKAARKELYRANLKESGLPPDQVFVELETFDDVPWGHQRWVEHLQTPAGQSQSVAVAYFRANVSDADRPVLLADPIAFAADHAGDAEGIIDAVEQADGSLVSLVADLCNLKLVPAGEGADKPGNAQAPPATE